MTQLEGDGMKKFAISLLVGYSVLSTAAIYLLNAKLSDMSEQTIQTTTHRQTTEDSTRFFTTQQRYRIGIDSFVVVVDRTTNNMYLQGRGTLSPFYDSEGMIYKYND